MNENINNTENKLKLLDFISDHHIVAKDVMSKCVIACKSDSQNLPFANEQFDCYLANLSLHLVDNPLSQIRECFRILEHGGLAGFTIWGRREYCKIFTIFG
jgi:ubiquinone/menaquinone biosynthesis C-methylase UbiE